jgi:hypothetical protein
MPSGDPQAIVPGFRARVTYAVAVTIVLHALIMWVSTSLPIFYGYEGPNTIRTTHERYYGYASRAVHGEIPYRDYVIEYPILGFFVFLIPRLIASNFRSYQVSFATEMLLFDVLAVYLVARRVERDEGIERVVPRLVWYTVFFASLCPMLVGRYDVAPMALAFAAADWWFSGRAVLGGVTAAVGALLKIVPGLVAGPALIWEVSLPGSRRLRGMRAFLITLLVGVALWWAIGGRGVLDCFRYHTERGLEIESLYAGIVFLTGYALGRPVPWVRDHDALHIAPEWGAFTETFVLPVQAASLLLVLSRFRWSGMADGVRYSGAALLAFAIMGKVLSPQFLIWLIPFMTVLGGETGIRARRIFLVACIATTMLYPIGFLGVALNGYLVGIALLNYRNLLLLVLLWLLLFSPDGQQRPQPASDDPAYGRLQSTSDESRK